MTDATLVDLCRRAQLCVRGVIRTGLFATFRVERPRLCRRLRPVDGLRVRGRGGADLARFRRDVPFGTSVPRAAR